MIKIRLSIKDINTYQTGHLPVQAKRIDTPQSTAALMKQATPIAVILCLLLFVTMFLKTIINKTSVIKPLFILFGFIIGLLLLIVHEWLHGIVYPKEADVTIGKLKGKMTFVALASYPLKRSRFIVMCLIPYVLGIIPWLIFIFSPPEWKAFNGILFGIACVGMVSPYPDVYNVIMVLKQSNKEDKIMFYKDDMYKIQ